MFSKGIFHHCGSRTVLCLTILRRTVIRRSILRWTIFRTDSSFLDTPSPGLFFAGQSFAQFFFQKRGQFFAEQFFARTILRQTIFHTDNSSTDDSSTGQFFTRTILHSDNFSPLQFFDRTIFHSDNSSLNIFLPRQFFVQNLCTRTILQKNSTKIFSGEELSRRIIVRSKNCPL
jgi:hypothetical protein